MPLQFMNRVTELLCEGKTEEEALAIASEEYDRRYTQELESVEKAFGDPSKTLNAWKAPFVDEEGYAWTPLGRIPVRYFSSISAGGDKERLQKKRSIGNRTATYSASLSSSFQIIKADKASRRISGYASVYNVPMRSHEMMGENAFSQETIDLYLTNPVLLLEHDEHKVIGVVEEIKQDERGLWCRARVDDDEIWDDIENGRLRAFSWGGQIVRSSPIPDLKAIMANSPHWEDPEMLDSEMDLPITRRIDEGELMEISVVALPNCAQALFSIAKSGGRETVSLWAPLTNVDEAERMVYGYAILFGEPDADGHIITREAVEEALVEYRQFANAREMHEPKAVGTFPVLRVDDRGLWVGLSVSVGAEDCWQKILDRTYKGFSIGGEALSWREGEHNGERVLFLTAIRLDEISVCDRPKAANATFRFVKREEMTRFRKRAPGNKGANMSTELETQKLTVADKFAGVMGRLLGKTDAAAEETKNSADTDPEIKITLDGKAKTLDLSPVVEKMTALVAEQNAAVRKDYAALLEEKTSTLQASFEAAITELREAAGLPPKSDPSETENAAKNKCDDDMDDENPFAKKSKAKKSKNSATGAEVMAAIAAKMQGGLSREDAFNEVASETGVEKFLDELGIPGSEDARDAEMSVEDRRTAAIVASAVEAATRPLVERLERAERNTTHGRRSAPVVNRGRSDDDEADSENVFKGLFLPKGFKETSR